MAGSCYRDLLLPELREASLTEGADDTASSFVCSIEESKLLNCLKLLSSNSYFLVGNGFPYQRYCEVGKDGINCENHFTDVELSTREVNDFFF